MTSGTFSTVERSLITVARDQRQRREPRGIEELAHSIRLRGLINPILVKRETYELVAGERRFLATGLLGWTEVPVQFTDELDPLSLRLIELEENTKREDLTWQEQCLAIAEFHEIKVASEPDWSNAKTADELGLSASTVDKKLAVAKELQNPVIAQAPKLSTAHGIVSRANSRKSAEAIASIMKLEAAPIEAAPESILCADFTEWAATYAGPRFNFVHCDFPYGIDADKRQQGYSHEEHGSYADTEEDYWNLVSVLLHHGDKLFADQAHIMFWFSMRYYHETKAALGRAFEVDSFPLIWTKSDNIGLLPDPERGPRRIYETAFFGFRGDRKIVRATSNSFASASVRDGHMSEKSQVALEHFFKMFVDGTTLMLDPTAGSGSALRAAQALGAVHLQGVEKNEEFAKRANERLNEQRKSK